MPKGATSSAHGTTSNFVLTLSVSFVLTVGLSIGCGTTKSFTATEQLLVSDAVDSTIAKIDFRPLSGRKAFIDNAYLPSQKGVPNPNPTLVHSEYVSSSIRQQMLAAGVFLCDKREDADLIVEVRMGALGFDGHSVTYGIPASNSISSAASSLSGSPLVPLLPEISFAKKEAKSGAAKVALFAYERQSLQPVWQSGIARSTSTARDTWLLGIGPLQNGTIYDGTRFAGSRVFHGNMGRLVSRADDEPEELVDYKRSRVFTPLTSHEPNPELAKKDGATVSTASATAPSSVTPVSPNATPSATKAPSSLPPVSGSNAQPLAPESKKS